MAFADLSREPLKGKPDAGWPLYDRLGIFAFTLVVGLLVLRLPLSLDLSDESYFAIFIDDWLKGGIRTSTLSTLHETSALVVYPLALLFHWVTGSSDGLLLFLRAVYLSFSIGMALVWCVFLRTMGLRALAWPVTIAAVGYIPFGLPAPSYNMLAMQGETISLAAFAIACVVVGSRRRGWMATSAAAGALACVAYPPLTLFLGVFCLLSFAAPSLSRREQIEFTAWVIGFFLAAWLAVLVALTPTGLRDSFVHLAALNSAGDVSRKIHFTINLLRWNKLFALMLIVAMAIGVLRPRLPLWSFAVMLIALTAGCFLLRPTLFLRAHDILTLWIATGLWMLRGLLPKAEGEARLIGILYGGSLVAGVITALSATWSPYNFCVGGFPAALLAIAYGLRGDGLPRVIAASALAAAMVWTGFAEHFGTDKTSGESRVDRGFFKGMFATPDVAALIEFMRVEAAPATEPEKTILVLGRYPGLSLATPARPKAIWVWFIAPDVNPHGAEYLGRFYLEDLSRRPRAVVIYKDRVLDPLNPMGENFQKWYEASKRLDLHNADDGTVTLYQLK